MNTQAIQTLVLRAPRGPAVAHLILRIPAGGGKAAVSLLEEADCSFGLKPDEGLRCSIGFSYAGLEALGVPKSYLRLFQRQALAFTQGALRRSVQVGDGEASAAHRWWPEFGQEHAHLLLSWHGEDATVRRTANAFADRWKNRLRVDGLAPHLGHRIGAPPQEEGEWMHFGYRDGISEVCIDDELPRPAAEDCRRHDPGALLLGHVNDMGFNSFALSRAPDKVRAFFRDSSFGILRAMLQDLTAFEDQLDRWVEMTKLPRDLVKAKLCGRWPNGRQTMPDDDASSGSLVLNLSSDLEGRGCPFGSHVRRMRGAPDRIGNMYARPLQRRSFPFGPPAWSERPNDGKCRGQFGHFFCASIEDQFEHLLGTWAARPPIGLPTWDSALDPIMGPHDDADAALAVPLKDAGFHQLRGFRAWTTTRGTIYTWHPSIVGLEALLKQDFIPEHQGRPWL